MSGMEIWHNPSCSKCATARASLDEARVPYRLRAYLAEPPSAEELTEVLRRLDARAWDICRTGEPAATELGMADWPRDDATEPRWVAYACHADAPWLSDRLRRRIRDFVTVLRCRFPTVQDTRSSRLAKTALRTLAAWRYSLGRYDRPWELEASQRFIKLLDPRATSI